VNANAPTAKPNKGVEFYNPGDRMSEPIPYSVDGAYIHTIARFVLDADERSYFNVPTEIKFLATNERISVDFPTTVCQKFKDRGIIMVDEDWTPSGDEEEDDKIPIARTREEAKEKGDRIWSQYLWTIIRRWQNLCNEIRAKGGIPEEAQGFTKRALKLLNMRDPAHATQDAIRRENDVNAPAKTAPVEDAAMRAELDETKLKLDKVLALLEAKSKVETAAAVETATKPKPTPGGRRNTVTA
jgi:hypothetical protein